MDASSFGGRRVPVPGHPRQFVRIRPLEPPSAVPLLVEPALAAINLGKWLASQASYVEELLLSHGALLFRGFQCKSAAQFHEVVAASGARTFDYTYRSTPRKRVTGDIFTSTEYPADHFIPLHNEMSYTRTWPSRLWFCCVQPAAEGGATPLADSRAVWRRIPEEVRTRFRANGVRYVRNYGTGLDLPWQEVFQTKDAAEVESYCRVADIEFEWGASGRLRTSQVCQAETTHPVTGETVWFNQAHLFHMSSLPASVSAALEAVFDDGDLPRNATFGDGAQIPIAMLESVRRAYEAEMLPIKWEAGDVLVVDNILVAHGRTPYRGARQVVVGMTA